MVSAYRSGKSLSQISEESGLSRQTVRNRLAAAGVTMRDRGTARQDRGGKVVSVWLFPADADKLESLAARAETSESEIIRRLIANSTKDLQLFGRKQKTKAK